MRIVLKILEKKSSTIVLAAGDDTVIRGWDIQSGNVVLEFTGHFSKVTDIVFDDQHKYLISCGRDKVVILWDLRKGRQLITLPAYESLEGMVLLPTAPHMTNIPQPEANSVLVAVAGEKVDTLQFWPLCGLVVQHQWISSLLTLLLIVR
ncbi:Transducin (beta)-like 3 [Homalodisca vitripennis]|nr:Transducin (beta)-like 3 [Homalodisca vitripennis]